MAWNNIYKALSADQTPTKEITTQFTEYFGIWNYEQTNNHTITWYTRSKVSQHETITYRHTYNATTNTETTAQCRLTSKARKYMN